MGEQLGLRSYPEYHTWSNIIQRCENPNNTSYARYGGVGITIAPAWRRSFSSFIKHIGRRPSPWHSVDRIDGSKGYQPGNVRWATSLEQAQNQSHNVNVAIGAETHCLSEWARIKNIPLLTIWSRINQLGWSPETAILTPSKGRGSNGHSYPAFDAAIAKEKEAQHG